GLRSRMRDLVGKTAPMATITDNGIESSSLRAASEVTPAAGLVFSQMSQESRERRSALADPIFNVVAIVEGA
ncbi:MAG: hypothetical protein ABIR32_06120, partial [Ilumatobacteraceae bacterium]